MIRISPPAAALAVGLLMTAGTLCLAQNGNWSGNSGGSRMHHQGFYRNSNLNSMDRMFLRQAAQANQEEVQEAKVVLNQINNSTQTNRSRWNRLAPLRRFADLMVEQHTAAQDALWRLARNEHIALPGVLNTRHREKVDYLSNLNRATLYRTYVREQRPDHEKAIALFERELRDGQNRAVKQYARRYLPILEHHLQLATDLNRNGFVARGS